jgi:hypothetical protein
LFWLRKRKLPASSAPSSGPPLSVEERGLRLAAKLLTPKTATNFQYR